MAKLFGSILIDNKCIDSEMLCEALEESKKLGIRLGECLIGEYGISETDIYQSLAEQFNIPFITGINNRLDKKLLKELPVELFNEGRCFPLYERDNTIGIVVSDPLDLDIVFDVELSSGMQVEVNMTTAMEMEQVWEALYVKEPFFKDTMEKITSEFEKQLKHEGQNKTLTKEEIMKRMESEPVVKMVQLIFTEAINQGASDIHIEPTEHDANVRFRINGMLVQHTKISRFMAIPVTSRIKIMADLDIAEKRVPQDGRIAHEEGTVKYDLRVSTLPTQYGEKTVIRILKHDKTLLDLKNIGLSEQDFTTICKIIEKPQGMIFVTGPTGSGKSTALFSCLNRIKNKAINITTIENPIEYKLEGITQVQVNEKAGLNFATTLRSILRQDPDVILIGEIRDPETAEIAVQAAQTGHLVFSTLHTNNAIAAITRLKDLGVPPFLIGSSLLAVIGQRLLRTLCDKCKRKAPVTEGLEKQWRQAFGSEISIPRYFFKANGCNKCNQSGYSGRRGIYEIAVVNEHIRTMVSEDSPEAQLRKAFQKNGMNTMLENGIELVRQGITSLDELLRVVSVKEEVV